MPRQRSRDPHGLKKKWNGQRRSRGPPSHSLLPGMCAFDRYILISIPGCHFERSGTPVRSASTSYNSILFRSALSNSSSFWVLSSADCMYAPCSLAHRLRRLSKCFSRASYVSSQYVRGPRFSLIIAISAPQLAQIAPSDSEYSMAWNAVENLSRLLLPFRLALSSHLGITPPCPFALPSCEVIG